MAFSTKFIFVPLILGLYSGAIYAQENAHKKDVVRPVVVIVSLTHCCAEEAWPEAEEKVLLEFAQNGVQAIVVQGTAQTESERRSELVSIGSAYRAAAAVRIVKPPSTASEAGVDLWITDRVTQKTVYRFLPLGDIGSGESALVAAFKTIELFRGSLQEIHLEPSPAQGLPDSIEKLTESPAFPPPGRKTLRLAGGFGGIFFARDVGSRGAPVLWLGWSPVDGFELMAEGAFGVFGHDIVRARTASSMFFNTISLKTMWVMRNSVRIKPAIGLMLGAAVTVLEGVRSTTEPQKKVHLTSGFFGVATQLSFSLTDSLWLTPAFDIGMIVPQAKVLFAGEEVARFGLPVLKAALMIDVHF